jgi:chromosome segregation ATPase
MKERQARSASRVEVLDNRQEGMASEIATVKTGLSAVSETPNLLRGQQALLDETEKAIAELRDRSARSASRIEAVASGLGDLSGKIEVQSEGARGMDDRLREAERALSQAQKRERALAQLHARAADALRGTEEA